MSHLYLANSLEELEKLAVCPGDFRNLLSDAKACATLCERAFKNIDIYMTLEDEELACVLFIQLVVFLQKALAEVSRDRSCDPNRPTWEAALSNHQLRAAEECNRRKKDLKSRYEKRVAERQKAHSYIEGLFCDRQSPSRNGQPFSESSAWSPSMALNTHQDFNAFKMCPTAPPGPSPSQSSTDLALAAPNDSSPDQPTDTYLASSLADLERFWLVDYGISDNISTCDTVGKKIHKAIESAQKLRDEELQFVLNRLLAAYMQRSKEASQKLANGAQREADEAFFKSHIELAQRRCKPLEDSLKSRYDKKSALKMKALGLIPNQAILEQWSESRNGSTDRPKSSFSRSPLYASDECWELEPSKTDRQLDEKSECIPWQPSTELPSPIGACDFCDYSAAIAQAADDLSIDSQANASGAALGRADHALATTDSLSVPAGAGTIVAVGTDSVAVVAASLTAAVVKEERTSDSPAAVAEAPPVGAGDDNARVANPQRASLPGAAGIKNQSNNCYMSSILQILNSLPGFLEFINEMAQQGSNRLASELASILGRLNDGTECELQELKNVLGATSSGKSWTGSNQEDAHEFFMHLISMLEQSPDGASAREADSNRPTGERRWSAKEQIEFTVRTLLRCSICNATKDNNDDIMHYLPIDVPDAADEMQIISECLEKFTQPQLVFYCCGNSSTSTTYLSSLPHVLILYVKRYARIIPDKLTNHVSSAGEHQKLKTAIKFPTENLDLRPLMLRDSEASHSGLYSLIGIVNHVGDELEKGHYTSHCKNLKDGLWYLFSDTDVKQWPLESASATDAYILFYVKCHPTARQL